jgi:hypothetical protein
MEDKDKEYLEALYKGFAMVGFLMNGDYSPEEIPARSASLAKAMMQDPEEAGIVSIKKRVRKA